MTQHSLLRLIAIASLFVINTAVSQPLTFGFNDQWYPLSYRSETGAVAGVLPDLTRALFKEARLAEPTLVGLSWNRVQLDVERGRLDGFVSFPSVARKVYSQAVGPIFYPLRQKPIIHQSQNTVLDAPFKLEDYNRPCALIGDGWSQQFYTERNITPVFGRDSKACLRMVAGGRADLFLHPAPIFKVLVNWLNLEDTLVQLDDVAGEMPFYLLLNIRDRPDVLSASQQLGAALLRLQNDGQWQKMLTKSEQRAIARCLKGGQTSC